MIDRSYLLKYLQTNDRILLYGKGRNVQLNYEYLKGQSQFRVVGIITPDADQVIDPAIPMYYPDQLKIIPSSSYDKIIITVRDQKQGIEMYQAIRGSGVGKEKIVAAHIYVGPATDISLEDFIGNRAQLQLEINKFIDCRYGNLHYFDPLIEELSKRIDERDALCEQFKKTVCLLSPLEKIIFLYILYLAGIFNADLMKCLVTSALQIDRLELLPFLHGIFNDEISMCFLHEEYLFPEYYTLRRAYIKKLCKMYDFKIQEDKIRKSPDSKIRKILMIHHLLSNHKHAPTLMSIQLSRVLAELGYEVKVMPLDTRSNISWEFLVFCPVYGLAYYESREFEEYHKAVYYPNVTVEYTDVVEPKEKLQSELDKIVAFSPDLIIDMGTEASIISYIYSKYFRTLCLPLNGCQSSTYFTYYGVIGDYDMFADANEVYHSVDYEQAVAIPRFHIIPKAHTEYQRGKYPLAQLNESDFILISVGNRIGEELTEDFIDIVCERLLNKQNIKWLIVGGTNEYLSQRYQRLLETHKITYIPYENDLPALYQICDVYISPKRRGGGTSAFWAMYYGLPIAQAMSPQSGTIRIIGSENASGETYEQIADYILNLWKDPLKYAEDSDKMRKRAQLFSEEAQKKGWKDFIDMLEGKQAKWDNIERS